MKKNGRTKMSEPTAKECKEAVNYFFYREFIDELTEEQYHYVRILLNATAWNVLYLDLKWEDDEDALGMRHGKAIDMFDERDEAMERFTNKLNNKLKKLK